MNYFSLVMKNVMRQKTRTVLTLIGISIGIATIVTLGMVSDGMKKTMGSMMEVGKVDFMIGQAGASDTLFSNVDESLLDEVREMPGIERVDGMIINSAQVPGNPYFVVFGATREYAEMQESTMLEGRMYEPGTGEIVLGRQGASTAGRKVGGTISLFGREFTVVGVMATEFTLQDGGGMIDLAVMQEVSEKQGKVTLGMVQVEPGADPDALAAQVERDYEDRLVTISDVEDFSKVDKGMDLIDAASWIISALAIVIGGIGVMNTMIISVYDRIREIGVLKALGWKSLSVMRMILGEALVIGVLAAVVGSLIGFGVVKLIMVFPAARSFISSTFPAGVMVKALVVSLVVSLLGGAFPAWRAARLSPQEALRYE
jgi:putative ABC transport system permease protein